MSDVFEKRRLVVKQVCESHWALNLGKKLNTWSILYDNPKNMVYCHVAKAGCTTWGRIFSFISRTDEMRRLNITTPFEIGRWDVHDGPLIPVGRAKWDKLKPELPATAKKFMFTRDPYARLWSVYLDKFYMPAFWDRRIFSSDICKNNVSFSEFLSHAMTSTDNHMSTVAATCNPCEFNPHFIGKMETFSRDAHEILKYFNYSKLLGDVDFVNYTVIEITTILSDYYLIYKIYNLNKCLSLKELVRRMWYVFQANGHIRSSSKFPEDLPVYTEPTVRSVLENLVRGDPITKEESRTQRRSSIVEAYKTVTSAHVRAIQEKFKSDFEMFDYDIRPPI